MGEPPVAVVTDSTASLPPGLAAEHSVAVVLRPMERVRTASRALARLEEIVVGEAGYASVDLAVQHLAAPDRAVDLAERLRVRVPQIRRLVVDEVGAVVGEHVGPGMLGVVLAPV